MLVFATLGLFLQLSIPSFMGIVMATKIATAA